MDFIFWLSNASGLVSLFGWLWALGHVALTKLNIHEKPPWLTFATSYATTAFLLSFFSLFFSFQKPISLFLGLVFVLGWWKTKPTWPKMNFSEKPSLFLGLTVSLLVVQAIYFILVPDRSFDSLSYHIPFIREFAAAGKISFPVQPLNWVDHVHYVFPYAVETVFGLVEQISPGLTTLLHFTILLAVLGGIYSLTKEVGVRDPWKATGFYLLVPSLMIFGKMFYVELSLFLWWFSLLFILWYSKIPSHAKIIVGSILALAMSQAKINVIAYILPICFLSYFLGKEKKASLAIGLSAIIGFVFFVGYRFVNGIDFWKELTIVQALRFSPPIAFEERWGALLQSFWHYIGSQPLGLGLIAGAMLVWKDGKSRFLGLALWLSLIGFGLAFGLTSLYFYTYNSFGIYAHAFIGIATILFIRSLDFVSEKITGLWRILPTLFLLFAMGLFIIHPFLIAIGGLQGQTFDTAIYYPKVLSVIPNTTNTIVFFMNNINPITVGLEKAQIFDHTTFPRMEGNPCDFFREKKITHVIYWTQGVSPIQINGGNAIFFNQTKELLRKGDCGNVLYDGNSEYSPIIARIV